MDRKRGRASGATQRVHPGFQEEAVQFALRLSKTTSEVGRELGINPETLRG